MVSPKFELHIPEEGVITLIIRTDDEKELESLLETWQPIIQMDYRGDNIVPMTGVKTRYYAADPCPLCRNKIITRRGRRGRFLACSNFPDCRWTQSL